MGRWERYFNGRWIRYYDKIVFLAAFLKYNF